MQLHLISCQSLAGPIELGVRVYNPQAQQTLIAWHGFARHGGDFSGLAQHLTDWRILAPDTPGRGYSAWAPQNTQDLALYYSYANYQHLALQLIAHYQLQEINWLGTSMGGLLGLRLAAGHLQGRMQRLILNDIGPQIQPSGVERIIKYLSQDYLFADLETASKVLRRIYAGFPLHHPHTWAQMLQTSVRRLPDGQWTFHYDPRIVRQFYYEPSYDLWAAWQNIAQAEIPSLIIRGAHSDILSLETCQKMQQIYPPADLFICPHAGHAPLLDSLSEALSLQAFLNDQGN
ncbi:Pimeloyl-ACP methyl ester carboxylesterase [Allopseudospirillum japonicum]|uniref:Pimeloyl-ACP methyl ester carboxylesterase n=1 Tax=Allopseudospirillum japonicum TaxID=64971 RepID=A0A1H6Q4H6_9GAMM|nr:alpha/beta hydrolase [Allopseudospirillum japonicum]SEI38729.1 Pimeloyl-ACP methyl ester carboxylesterase [Allopseudospirillum japonicum]